MLEKNTAKRARSRKMRDTEIPVDSGNSICSRDSSAWSAIFSQSKGAKADFKGIHEGKDIIS